MRNYLILLPLVGFLFSCSTPEPTRTLNGVWKLLHYENQETSSIYAKPDHVPGEVVIAFTDKGRRGTFEGHTVINPVNGKYALGENNALIINEIDGQLQRDPDWAHAFWPALASATSYQVSGSFLEIYYQEEDMVMVFQRTEDL